MKCCNRELTEHYEEIILFDVGHFINRFIRLYICTHCGRKRAELRYYDQHLGKFIYEHPKAKHTKEFVDSYKKEKYLVNVVSDFKVGTKTNSQWFYGKDGKQYDFNDVSRGKI